MSSSCQNKFSIHLSNYVTFPIHIYNNVKHRHIINIIKLCAITLLCMLMALPCDARKKDKPKPVLTSEQQLYGLTEPDAPPTRPRPDHHPKPLPQPMLFAGGAINVHGFDLSHYQGKVNWDLLAEDHNAGFIYLKASEGEALTDDTYQHNFDECKRVGLPVGSYHFFRGQLTARDQFRNFMSMVLPKRQDLIPLVDVEVLPKGVSYSTYFSRLRELCDMIEKEFGCKPMIYTGLNFYNRHFTQTNLFRGYKFMIAAYLPDEPVLNNNDDYLIWQYTAKGSARGVRGNIDTSRFVGKHTLREIMYKP